VDTGHTAFAGVNCAPDYGQVLLPHRPTTGSDVETASVCSIVEVNCDISGNLGPSNKQPGTKVRHELSGRRLKPARAQ